MKPLLALLLVVLPALATNPSFAKASEGRPNIVLLLGDDQAWTDYGFMGHEVIKTPQLDKLANQGLVLERGYVTAPLCRPSLASIITGRYPFTHGITGNDVDGPRNRAELDKPLRERFHQLPSFIRLLTSNGYLAHQSGKWWEGSWKDGGFTHGMTHGDPARGGRHGDAGLKIGREGLGPIKEFVDHAVAGKKPFFLWYAPFLPHTPHNPPGRLLKKYQQEGRAPDVAKYYAMCEWYDETCGQLIGILEDHKVRDNTIIIMICDNGWAAPSTNKDHPNQKLWKGYAQRSKSSPYEKGTRTPIIISWPDRIKPARSSDLAVSIDLFPTLAKAVGLEAPDDLPGIDLLDADARAQRDTIFGTCYATYNMTPEDPDGTLQYLWGIQGDWKLLVRHHGKDTTKYRALHVWDTAPVRLYNLKDDPHEKNDLAEERPEIVARLRARIEAWHPVK